MQISLFRASLVRVSGDSLCAYERRNHRIHHENIPFSAADDAALGTRAILIITYVCMNVYISVHVCIHVCICVCLYVYVCMYMYVYIYIFGYVYRTLLRVC